ncbi:MAG: hypothetical protein AAF593_00660 [Planctomycetota bacterium]
MTNQTNTPNRPVETLRDGNLKASIWANFGENGTFYNAQITRTYTDEAGKYHDSTSFSGSELLRVSHLSGRVYDRINQLRAADAEARAKTG